VVTGHAEVREVFMVRRRPQVAGSYITDGVVTRGDQARVQRDGEEIIDSKVETLRRFQEDAREVQTGFECGIVLENFTEFQQGDIIEFYHRERDN
jgi:translation initiation factor IF-2